MGDFNIDTGSGEFKITQKAGDLIEGLKQGDLSRISAYGESTAEGKGLHTGSDSPTVGRHNTKFGNQ